MPKNITYHQTGARQARRTRNDAFAVAGLGAAGMGATKGKVGLIQPAKAGYHGGMAHHAMGGGAVDSAKEGVKYAGRLVRQFSHPGRAAAEAAAVGGGAIGVAAEARNIHHTRAEQKLRRNRGVSKAMAKKTYCKQHGKFDACAEQAVSKGMVGDVKAIGRLKAAQGVSRLKVAAGKPGGVDGGKFLAGAQAKANMAARKEKKALGPLAIVGKRHGPGGGDVGDDGIHHLTGVERVRVSRETRGTGGLVPLVVGRRKLDGTPKMGHGDSSSKISDGDKAGASGRSKPVGSSRIREQIGKAADDPFELSKSVYTKADRHLERAEHGLGQAARLTIPPAAGAVVGGALGNLVAGRIGGGVGLVGGGIMGARSGVQRAERASQARKKRLAKVSKAHDVFLDL